VLDVLDVEAGLEQCAAHVVGGRRGRAGVTSEQVDVLGGAGDHAVGDPGQAAAEGEAVSAGDGQRDLGDLAVEGRDLGGHAAGRSWG
jgi:hypothetical protein